MSILPLRASGVFEETLSFLLADISSRNELAQHFGNLAALALPPAVLQSPIEDVEAAEVEKVEWAHRPVQAFLDSDVDVLRARVTALEQAHRFLGSREQDAVDDETPDLFLQEDRRACDAADELHRDLDSLVRGLGAARDLAQLHHRNGMEEVHVAALLRASGEVGDPADGR